MSITFYKNKNKSKKLSPIIVALNILLLVMIVGLILWYSLLSIGVVFDFSFISEYSQRIYKGFLTTIQLSIASLLLSLAIGIITAICHSSKVLIVKYASIGYVQFIRGTPLIMQIYLFFYIIGTAFGIENRFISGVIILSIFEGAYISEIIRGSLLCIDASQIEAARAVGFTKKQTLIHVIIPQITAKSLPALSGQFASIIKDSSLLSIISVIELTQTVREISAINFRLFESYLFIGVLYLCLTLPLSLITKKLESRFSYEN